MLHQLQNLTNQFTINVLSFKHSNGQPYLLRVRKTTVHCPVKSMSTVKMRSARSCFSTHTMCPWHEAKLTKNWERHDIMSNRPSGFKSHSFRIGAATMAAAMGFSDNRIRQFSSPVGSWMLSKHTFVVRREHPTFRDTETTYTATTQGKSIHINLRYHKGQCRYATRSVL